MIEERLPVSGFVLAGGRSSRMGRDKALVPFLGWPMVEIALATLGQVCETVSISTNNEALARFGQLVLEGRDGFGPGAGIEASILASVTPWALMMPVDLPLMSVNLLRTWMTHVLRREGDGVRASYLRCGENWHPALCLVHKDCLATIKMALDRGDKKLRRIFDGLGSRLLIVSVEDLPGFSGSSCDLLANLNTPEDIAVAEKLGPVSSSRSIVEPLAGAGHLMGE